MGLFQNIFGKREAPPNYSSLVVDMHSHLIPGIDDGAQTMEQSLDLVRRLQSLGFQRLITTPHIMSDAFRNTPEIILGGLEKLKAALKENDIAVEIEAAAEYYLDEAFIELVEKGELLTFGGEKRYVLYETSLVSKPLSLKDTIFQMKTRGYTPVLAHPERYQYFWDLEDLTPIRSLRSRGTLFQVNLTSFAGTRGRRAARIAKEMAKEGLIDFIGTDLHRKAQVPTLQRALDLSKELRQLLESGSLRNAEL